MENQRNGFSHQHLTTKHRKHLLFTVTEMLPISHHTQTYNGTLVSKMEREAHHLTAHRLNGKGEFLHLEHLIRRGVEKRQLDPTLLRLSCLVGNRS